MIKQITGIEYIQFYIYIYIYIIHKTFILYVISRGDLVPKFGLNKSEDEPQKCVLTFEDKKYGAIVPISFKLLRTCYIRLNENEDLSAIDSLLGCAILMPDLEITENFVIDLVICCINW